MNCQEVRLNVYAYLDGLLPAPSQRAFNHHLSGCPGCRAEVSGARDLHLMLKASCTPVDAPPDFVNMVMQRLEQTQPQQVEATSARQDCRRKQRAWPQIGRAIISRPGRLPLVAGFILSTVLTANVFLKADLTKLASTGVSGAPQTTASSSGAPVLDSTEPKIFLGLPDPALKQGSGSPVPSRGQDQPATPVTGSQSGSEAAQPDAQSEVDGGPKSSPVPADTTPAATETGTNPTPAVPALPGSFELAGQNQAEGTISLAKLVDDAQANSVKPVWSPDGREVWFFSGKNSAPGSYRVWSMSADGRELQVAAGRPENFPLAFGLGAWSASRNKIAYIDDKDGYLQIFVSGPSGKVTSITPDVSGDAKKRREQNPVDYWAYWPVWSVKDDVAYLTTRFDDSLDIMAVDDQGVTHRLTGGPANDLYPAWSPDGSRLAFYRSERDAAGRRINRIYVAQRDGSNPQPLTQPIGVDSLVPAWSPDSKLLAFNAGFAEPQGGTRQRGLWVVGSDGSDLTQLAPVGGGRLINWSPDGKKIAFNDSVGSLYVLVFIEQGKTQLIRAVDAGEGNVANVTWSQDSSQILFDWAKTGGTTQIWVASLSRGQAKP